MADVQRAVHAILRLNKQLVLMQCNTNYTASPENYDHIHLNVLRTYAVMFPEVVLGLSDHTHGNATVLGAVALGARVIERHFTDDNAREGPDHKFAMNPSDWAHMVEETDNWSGPSGLQTNSLQPTSERPASSSDGAFGRPGISRRGRC